MPETKSLPAEFWRRAIALGSRAYEPAPETFQKTFQINFYTYISIL